MNSFTSSGSDRALETLEGFKVEVDADGYKPEELSVSVDSQGRKVTVNARHEAEGVCRKFSRQYQVQTLPQNIIKLIICRTLGATQLQFR